MFNLGMSKDPETGGPIDIYDNLSDGYAISQNANKKDEALINTKENSSNGESSILGNGNGFFINYVTHIRKIFDLLPSLYNTFIFYLFYQRANF
jgi:hypothetical protein